MAAEMAIARRRFLAGSAASLVGPGIALPLMTRAGSARSSDQGYPDRPVRVVVPFPPGGATDNVARVVAKGIGEVLGQSFIIENKGGANGRLGTELVVRAPADGYTLLFGGIGALTIAPHLERLPYDPVSDLKPISAVVAYDSLLLAHASLPVSNVPELVAYLKAHAGRVNYASSGGGGPYHMAFELFKALAGVQCTHVPYKGDGLAIVDLAAGNVQCMITSVSAAQPHLQSGRIRILASAGSRRVSRYPDLATIAEQGVAGYSLETWGGLFAPAGTPDARVGTVNRALLAALDGRGVREGMAGQGGTWIGEGPEAFAGFVEREHAKWGKLIRERGLTS